MCTDVIYVCSMPFLITISRKVKMLTAEWLAKLTIAKMRESIKKVTSIYSKNDFKIKDALTDEQFDTLRVLECTRYGVITY